jgi:biofilm PGA synthesis lipoprotein PgaB
VLEASFPTWHQLREMADSGLVEMASHTYDLHHGVLANPQGNLQAAATTRIYDASSGAYEDEADWRRRVGADLARNSKLIEKGTGQRPRAIVWPYGSYNDELMRMAGTLGMTIGLTLEEGANTPDVPLTALRRILVAHNPDLTSFAVALRGPLYREPVRVVQVNLDDVYSADPLRQEENLSRLLDRIQALKPSDVYLQATSYSTTDNNGDGSVEMTYFPNRHLPMRGDLFSRAAWQLISRDDVNVYAVMPLSAAQLSPQDMTEVYEDLASHANFAGLVFEDKSSPGAVGIADTTAFTRQLLQHASAFRAPLKTVRATRNVQNVPALAAGYNYVALYTPIASVSELPENTELRRKLVFMLQHGQPVGDPKLLDEKMRTLQLDGALNFGYVPDNVLHDDPPFAQFAPAMSLRENPLPQRNGSK